MAWLGVEGARRWLGPWPSRCAVCAQWHTAQPCPACVQRFASPRARCLQCALPLDSQAQLRCGQCLRQPPPFVRTVTAFDYAFPWDGLISAMKFGGDLSLLPALVNPLIQALAQPDAAEARAVDWVLPMPQAPARLRERGFNQAWELARRVAQATRRPARHDLLLRWRDTPHQTGLTQAERQANLRGAFMPDPTARALLAGRHVALVDDVMTTGASAREACAALLEAGVAQVSVWLLARTPPQRSPD